MTDMTDRKDLKIQALLEKISQLTTQYENQAADYRVEITMHGADVQRLTQENQELQRRVDALEGPTTTEDTDASDDSDTLS